MTLMMKVVGLQGTGALGPMPSFDMDRDLTLHYQFCLVLTTYYVPSASTSTSNSSVTLYPSFQHFCMM